MLFYPRQGLSSATAGAVRGPVPARARTWGRRSRPEQESWQAFRAGGEVGRVGVSRKACGGLQKGGRVPSLPQSVEGYP